MMRPAVLAALLASAALAFPASAQTQPQVTPNTVPEGEARAKAAVAECDRLMSFLNSSRPVGGVSMEQARRWKDASDVDQCRSALQRITQASTETGSDRNPPQAVPPTATAGGAPGGAGYGTTPGSPGAPGDDTRAAATASGPAVTGALPSGTESMQVSRLEDMTIYSARDEKLGEVEDVVTGADGKAYVVIEHGGFLGIGEKKSVIPLEQLAMRQDRLVADRLTDEELKALPAYDKKMHRVLEDRQTAPVRVIR